MASYAKKDFVPTGVWRVRGVHNTVYLVGTSHVIPEDQIPFPSPFYAAYHDSQIVYVEFNTDLSLLAKLRLVPRLTGWIKARQDTFIAPKGKTMADYLPPETLAQIKKRYRKDFARQGVTPIFLLFMNDLGMLEATEPTAKPSGVEEPFELLAHRDGKPLRQLDDGDVINTAVLLLDQMIADFQREISKRGADAVVREALLGDRKEENASWRYGDLAAVAQLHEEMKKDSQEIYEKALPDRNRKWVRKLEPLLHGKKNAMVLVGVAHIGGNEGLLNLLRDAGFPAEQMYGVDHPKSTIQIQR